MEQKIAFALRSSSPELKKELNQFLIKYCKTDNFSELKKKYFGYIDKKGIVTNYWPKENISPYDDLFKSAAKKYSWDWKMLAAISYQESRFNPNAVGVGGSFGLMQFMPKIGRAYGITPNSSPKEQIDAAIESLNKIYLSWNNIPNSDERIKFTLASYNAGKCHIQDAQKLAAKKGLNPLIWDKNVELMIKNLADPKIYISSDIRCGAYRGGAVAYVRIIYSKYQSWR
jgi:membrane-bound lytic murein transglycosylase F